MDSMNAREPLVNTAIITDAGWEKLPYQAALTWFRPDELMAWWAYTLEQVVEEQLWLDMDPDDVDANDQPQFVQTIVAKAVFRQHKWLQIATLHDWWLFRDEYEEHAIRFGVRLRQSLGRQELEIINDNKKAVTRLRKEYSGIRWRRRSAVRAAHALRRQDATKTFGPTDPWRRPHC